MALMGLLLQENHGSNKIFVKLGLIFSAKSRHHRGDIGFLPVSMPSVGVSSLNLGHLVTEVAFFYLVASFLSLSPRIAASSGRGAPRARRYRS